MIIRTKIFFFFFSSSPSFLFHNRFPLFIAGFLSFSTDSDWWMTAHFVVVVAKLLLRLFIRSFSFAHIARLFRRSLVRLPDLLVPTFTRHGNERFLSYCAGQCQCQMHFTSLSPLYTGPLFHGIDSIIKQRTLKNCDFLLLLQLYPDYFVYSVYEEYDEVKSIVIW